MDIERRAKMLEFENRLVTVEASIIALREEIQANSAATLRTEYNTSELVSMFKTTKGITRKGVKFGLWVATTLKYMGGLALAIGAIWAVVSSILSGKPPSLH